MHIEDYAGEEKGAQLDFSNPTAAPKSRLQTGTIGGPSWSPKRLPRRADRRTLPTALPFAQRIAATPKGQ
jgi:hypothetical protein